jgi:transient receptor potential cation channel subfamily M protein 3
MWNPYDAAAIIFFLIGLFLRLHPSSMQVGRLIFCVDIVYWYVRILSILAVNKYLGPLVTMMGRMVKDTILFICILLVVLLSYSSCHQSILHPDREPSLSLVREMFFKPYFMLYGEVFAESINPPCDNESDILVCQMGHRITMVQTIVYLFLTNILLINLLIAVHNNTFDEVSAISHQVWMSQRFRIAKECEMKPPLPPPLTLLWYMFLFFKHCHHKVRGLREPYDNAMKLSLNHDALVHTYYFEEDCMDDYFQAQKTKLRRSNDGCIRNTYSLLQKIEDINQEHGTLTLDIQGAEAGIRKVYNLTDRMLPQLADIHRSMGTNVQEEPLSMSDLPDV